MRTVWMLLGALLIAGLTGCATGPSLKALSADDAKIAVYPDGRMLINGEAVPLGELSTRVKRSATQPQDPVVIRLHGDTDSPEMLQIRRVVSDQMIRANHLKFNFVSTPKATVTVRDPRTGKTTIQVKEQDVREFSGTELHAEADRIKAEEEAYKNGTYVSEAANRPEVEAEAEEEPEKPAIRSTTTTRKSSSSKSTRRR